MISICSWAPLALILASESWPWSWLYSSGRESTFWTWLVRWPPESGRHQLGDQLLELLLQLVALELDEQVALVDPVAVLDGDVGDDPRHRGVGVRAVLGQQRAPPLDRQLPGDERQDRDHTDDRQQDRHDLGQRPAPEEPPGGAHRLEHRQEEDLVVLLSIPERRRGVPRDDLGAGVRIGRRHLVADLLGDQAAERHLLLALLAVLVGLGLVQEGDDDGLRARLVDVHLEGVADVGGEALGVARVDQVLARADHDLAEPGQLADQVGPLLDDLLAADRLDHHPAADLQGHAQPVAADEPLAVVGDGVGRLLQVERAVDLVGEPFELVPEPLLRHHLPHLAVLQVAARQVAEVADEPQRALLRSPRGGSGPSGSRPGRRPACRPSRGR